MAICAWDSLYLRQVEEDETPIFSSSRRSHEGRGLDQIDTKDLQVIGLLLGAKGPICHIHAREQGKSLVGDDRVVVDWHWGGAHLIGGIFEILL